MTITLRTIKTKQIVEVTREDYDNLVSSGLIRRYRVISSIPDKGKPDAEKLRDINEFVKKIAETKPVKEQTDNVKRYKELKKTDKAAALALLKELATKNPDNKYFQKELKQYNDETTTV